MLRIGRIEPERNVHDKQPARFQPALEARYLLERIRDVFKYVEADDDVAGLV
jgi:hypothetical protein